MSSDEPITGSDVASDDQIDAALESALSAPDDDAARRAEADIITPTDNGPKDDDPQDDVPQDADWTPGQ